MRTIVNVSELARFTSQGSVWTNFVSWRSPGVPLSANHFLPMGGSLFEYWAPHWVSFAFASLPVLGPSVTEYRTPFLRASREWSSILP